jgi:hypothetical protein
LNSQSFTDEPSALKSDINGFIICLPTKIYQ